jgi:hypothetical protein
VLYIRKGEGRHALHLQHCMQGLSQRGGRRHQLQGCSGAPAGVACVVYMVVVAAMRHWWWWYLCTALGFVQLVGAGVQPQGRDPVHPRCVAASLCCVFWSDMHAAALL